MGIEFLGNKKQLEDFLMQYLTPYISAGKTFFDLFSGCGSVSLMAKKRGANVISNDFMFFSTCMTKALLENNNTPCFSGLKKYLTLSENDPYSQVIEYLNSIGGYEGFIYSHYSPASQQYDGVKRMYFTEENAKKIDAIRMQIEQWSEVLKPNEKALLIADLLDGVSGVSNIAGTYGCYMKYWKKKAITPIRLCKRELVESFPGQSFTTINGLANEVVSMYDADLIYMDPPYTKRQYSAYYHILETIALYDSPTIFGKTGLRNWRKQSSDYCYKSKASKALNDLLGKVNSPFFAMSYSNEGQIEHDKILDIMEEYGKVEYHEQPYKRYKSNNRVTNVDGVIERLYILELAKK